MIKMTTQFDFDANMHKLAEMKTQMEELRQQRNALIDAVKQSKSFQTIHAQEVPLVREYFKLETSIKCEADTYYEEHRKSPHEDIIIEEPEPDPVDIEIRRGFEAR